MEKLLEIINKYAPQRPKHNRSENDMVEYLYSTIITVMYAENTLTECWHKALIFSAFQY